MNPLRALSRTQLCSVAVGLVLGCLLALGAHMLAVQPPAHSRVVVVGATGQGKSVWRARYVEPVRRVILLDPFSEVQLGGGSVTVDELEQLERDGELRNGIVRLVVTPSDWDDLPGELARCCEVAEKAGNVLFAVEEISFYVEGPAPSQTPAAFKRLTVAGRHQRVSMLVVAQRFAQVPTMYRGNASRVVAYRQPDPDDARELAKRLVGQVTPEQIVSLADHHYLDWSPTTGVGTRAPLAL